MATMTERKKAEKFLEEWEKIPLKYQAHYEVACADNAEAENLAYEISDGMGPMVEADVEGNMLYFRTDLVSCLVGKSNTDYAKIVSEWPGIKGRAKFVEDSLSADFDVEHDLKELASADGWKVRSGYDRMGIHYVVLEGKDIVIRQDGLMFTIRFRGGKFECDWLMPPLMGKRVAFETTQGLFTSPEDLFNKVKAEYPKQLKQYKKLISCLYK